MADPQKTALDTVRRWRRRLKAARKGFDADFIQPGKKIVQRYRDERRDSAGKTSRRYNLLWSNIQTLQPAVYSKEPVIYVSRRYQDADPIARLACQVMERAVAYQTDVSNFDGRFKQARDDYLLVGRGTVWARYEPIIETIPGQADEMPAEEDGSAAYADETAGAVQSSSEDGEEISPDIETEQVTGETAVLDYVFWRDFLHDPAPVWQEVKWVARDVLMGKEKCEKRFPELADRLSYTHRRNEDPDKPYKTQQRNEEVDLALVTEIWDKETSRVIWLSEDIPEQPLDERPDPLGLTGFFPCPEPLYATLSTDTLIPRPDYALYQDQAQEIDNLTQRINLLTKALAVRGAYDGSNSSLSRLLSEQAENFLVPVNNWAAFAEKGGLKSAVSFVPIDQVAAVIKGLIEQRAILVQDVYQITGISDIVRGQSNPNETLGAQQIKGNFATLRLDERKRTVAKFCRDSLRLIAEIIAEHFDPQTIREMTGFDSMTEVVQLNQTQPGAADMLWEQISGMLRNDRLRMFKLDIETDSTTVLNQNEEQMRRTQFLEAVGGFLEKSMAAVQADPRMLPLLGQMLLFGVRGFPIGRELEGAFEQFVQQAQAQPAPMQGQNGQAANAEAAAKAQAMQADAESQKQHDAMRAQEVQTDAALKSKQQQLDATELAHTIAMDRRKAATDEKLGFLDLVLKHRKANGSAPSNMH